MRIMDTAHPQWEDFVDYMNDPHSCFLLSKEIDLDVPCDHTHRLTRLILQTFPGVDVEGSLKFLREYGCNCYCEFGLPVLLKIAADSLELSEEESLVADLWLSIKRFFSYFEEQGVRPKAIKQEVTKAAAHLAEKICRESEILRMKSDLTIIQGGAQ